MIGLDDRPRPRGTQVRTGVGPTLVVLLVVRPWFTAHSQLLAARGSFEGILGPTFFGVAQRNTRELASERALTGFYFERIPNNASK